jgi:spermidine synthase
MRVSKYVALLSVFFLSGYCALTYEVAWTRLLDHIFGISVFATTTVLATFMTGLAVGALISGRRADIAHEPLHAYALVELGIGLCAFATPAVFRQLEPLYGWCFRAFSGHPVLLTAGRASLAVAALIIPASLMGATFPLMTRALVRGGITAGRDLGLLYGVNTLGGVAGCLGAGFVLLAHLGTSDTIYLSGALNVVVAGLALLVARGWPVAELAVRQASAAPAQSGPLLRPAAASLLVIAVFGSGFISLAHEVVWFRGLLSYVYNSTYAFSLMLAMFLMGLAIGGIAYGTLPARLRGSLGFVGVLTGLVGVSFWMSGLLFPGLNRHAYGILGIRFVDSWVTGLALIGVECALILLIPATLLGMTFPASLHLLTASTQRFGLRIGRLYSLNTLGGIAGSLVAGFIMIPLLGMRDALLTLVALHVMLGLAIVASSGNRTLTAAAVSAAMAALLLVPLPPADMFVEAMNIFKGFNRLIFYREGITDTTGVTESNQTGARVVVYSDGRGTAGTDGADIQKFFGHVPMLIHPQPRRVLNICFGVGNSMSAIIKHDPERVDVVELSAHVRETAPFFWTNDGVLDDPRVRLIVEDGAAYVRYTDQRYDVISLEPPEMHTAGVVNLYTREFYEAAARTLNPGGMLEQWFTTSQMEEPELKMLLRSFMTVFPYTVIFTEANSTNYTAIGSKQPITLDLDVVRAWWQRPKVAEHLRSIGIQSPEHFLSFYVADQDRLWEYAGRDGPLVTDDRTYVDFMIPRSSVGGFGFGIFNPKFREPFRRRVAEDWALIDRLQATVPLAPLVRSTSGSDSLQATVDSYRAQRRQMRMAARPNS